MKRIYEFIKNFILYLYHDLNKEAEVFYADDKDVKKATDVVVDKYEWDFKELSKH